MPAETQGSNVGPARRSWPSRERSDEKVTRERIFAVCQFSEPRAFDIADVESDDFNLLISQFLHNMRGGRNYNACAYGFATIVCWGFFCFINLQRIYISCNAINNCEECPNSRATRNEIICRFNTSRLITAYRNTILRSSKLHQSCAPLTYILTHLAMRTNQECYHKYNNILFRATFEKLA